MSFKVMRQEWTVDVEGEEAIHNGLSVYEPSFLPDSANIVVVQGRVSVRVTGQQIGSKGRLMSTQRGFAHYLQEDINEGLTPAWVVVLIGELCPEGLNVTIGSTEGAQPEV